jgi:hypothetical protein
VLNAKAYRRFAAGEFEPAESFDAADEDNVPSLADAPDARARAVG